MRRLFIACLALVGISLLIFHQLGRLEELTARLAGLRKDVALRQIHRLPEPAAAIVVKPAPSVRTERLELLIQKAHRVMGGFPLLHPEDLFHDYPRLETAFLAAMEGQLRIEYGGFFALAGFSEPQIDRFLEISLAGERDWIALTKEAAARGVTLSDPTMKLLGQERANQRKRDMEELLGPEGLALRERYREERPARNALTALTKAAAFGRHPLSFDQVNRLAALTTELGVFDNDRPLRAMDIFSGASSKAAAILTPEQQQLFELVIDARQAALLRTLNRGASR